MASYLALLWSTGLRQLVAYPPPPRPMSRPGQAGLLVTGAQWKSRAYRADLVVKLKGISEGKPNMTENQPKISN